MQPDFQNKLYPLAGKAAQQLHDMLDRRVLSVNKRGRLNLETRQIPHPLIVVRSSTCPCPDHSLEDRPAFTLQFALTDVNSRSGFRYRAEDVPMVLRDISPGSKNNWRINGETDENMVIFRGLLAGRRYQVEFPDDRSGSMPVPRVPDSVSPRFPKSLRAFRRTLKEDLEPPLDPAAKEEGPVGILGEKQQRSAG